MGTLDEFGVMTITDRSKDVIKSGGEWISSIAIENIAVSHPKVQLCSYGQRLRDDHLRPAAAALSI